MENKNKNKNKSQSLKVNAIPKLTEDDHPDPPDERLLKHEFSAGLIAPKGSGKTTLLVNILEFYRGYFHSILIFTPTANNDDKWEYVKKQDYLAENSALKKFIKMIKNSNENNKVVSDGNEVDIKKFNAKIPHEHIRSDYDEETLQRIMEEQDAVIKFLTAHGKTRHLANRILMIFDDMVGSNLFSEKRTNNPFMKLCTNHRHYSTSTLAVTQAYKIFPRTMRVNLSGLMMFNIPNRKEVNAIYEENPVGLDSTNWEGVLDYCTREPFGFMFINYQKNDPNEKIMKNFDTYIHIKENLDDIEASDSAEESAHGANVGEIKSK